MLDRLLAPGRRRLAILTLFSVGAVALTALALALAIPPSAAEASHATVQMSNAASLPRSITVQAGGKVSWVNRDSRPHIVASVDGTWNSGLVPPGATFEHAFAKPGIYTYRSDFLEQPGGGFTQGQVVVLAAPQETASPTSEPYVPDPSQVQVPAGYTVDVLATGFVAPSAMTVDDQGRVYVAESGIAGPPARIIRINADGSKTVVAPSGSDQFIPPLLGIAWGPNGFLYASDSGRVVRVNPDGSLTPVITDLPVGVQNSNNNIAFGPDGKLYVAVGTRSETGVMERLTFEAPPGATPEPPPAIHDIPCRDITLVGRNYTDTFGVVTGAFQNYGVQSTPGQVVQGSTKCNGAVLRANPDGSGLDVAAWGFFNPYGITFAPLNSPLAGALLVDNNGTNGIGVRPIYAPDTLNLVLSPSANTAATAPWFGWPDYFAGHPVTDTAYFSPTQGLVLQTHPPLSMMSGVLGYSVVPTGMAVSTNPSFGFVNDLFIAYWQGGRGPGTGPGPSVQRLHPMLTETGTISWTQTTFAFTPMADMSRGLNHPIDVKFSPEGNAMYILDFGGEGPGVPGTVFRVRRAVEVTTTPTTTGTPMTATPTTTGTAATTTTTPTPTTTGTPGTCQSGTVDIAIRNFAFVPSDITVCRGATVRWTNFDTAPHTSTSDTGVWDSGLLLTNQSFSFTFNTLGDFPYHCSVHPNMHGIVRVVEGPEETTTPTPTGTSTTVAPTGTTTVTTTPTTEETMTATVTATTVPSTMTATATATAVPPTMTATVTATAVPPTMTATTTATATAVPPTATTTPTVTVTPRPTSAPVNCSAAGSVCAGILYIRTYIDRYCDGTFDLPLPGTTVTVTLPDGTTRTAISDAHGDAYVTGIYLAPGQSITVTADNPPLPTWMQATNNSLIPCVSSQQTISTSQFTFFGNKEVDFRWNLASLARPTVQP